MVDLNTLQVGDTIEFADGSSDIVYGIELRVGNGSYPYIITLGHGTYSYTPRGSYYECEPSRRDIVTICKAVKIEEPRFAYSEGQHVVLRDGRHVQIAAVNVQRREYDGEKPYYATVTFRDGPTWHYELDGEWCGGCGTSEDDIIGVVVNVEHTTYATGGMKYDDGKLQPSLLFYGMPNGIQSVTAVLGYGAQKYEAHSWRTVPNAIKRYTDALQRHVLAHGAGETYDAESGLPHLAHIATNALFLLELESGEYNDEYGDYGYNYTRYNTPVKP